MKDIVGRRMVINEDTDLLPCYMSDLAHNLHWCWMLGLLVNLLGLNSCTDLATHMFSHWWSRVNDWTGISNNLNKLDCYLSPAGLPRSNIPPSLMSACWSVPITCFPVLSRHFLYVTLCFLFLFSSPIQIKSLVLIPLQSFPLQTLPFFETCVLTFPRPERRLPQISRSAAFVQEILFAVITAWKALPLSH